MTHATEQMRHGARRQLSLAAVAVLLAVTFAAQAHAAAQAPDVDPSRYSVGNIVYPPGVKPAAGTETLQNGEVVKTPPSTAITIESKAKRKAKHKSAQ